MKVAEFLSLEVNTFTFTDSTMTNHFLLFPDIDECVTNPCLHNGTCINTVGNYNCSCTAGWEGNDCEIGIFLTMLCFTFGASK